VSRTAAIVLTALAAIFCGLPGLGIICLAGLGLVGSQMPGYEAEAAASSPSELMLGALLLVCFGSILLLIPVIVGFFSYRLNIVSEDVAQYQQPMPPNF
jgi:hypothetical protein